ncbi:MAG TPA: cytochrome b/b6 domain-containing protein [Steroidobacteraceae bacterium]|nr:cytochrome b/b6 domain-containing protein [Steroidobacteraceae bacterium]
MTEAVEPPSPSAGAALVRVWDVPTRVVHWSLVLLVVLSWWTAENGHMEWHRWSGYGLLALLIFRIFWGFAGSSTARFSDFVRGPRAIASHLRGGWTAAPGHNPLGALSVVALLVLLATQVVLGLFAVDVDGIESGPLSTFVSFETGRAAAQWHEGAFDVLSWLIGLHIIAVLYYWVVKKEKLIGAMVHGKRAYPEPLPQPLRPASALRLVLGVVIAAGITWMVTRAFQF